MALHWSIHNIIIRISSELLLLHLICVASRVQLIVFSKTPVMVKPPYLSYSVQSSLHLVSCMRFCSLQCTHPIHRHLPQWLIYAAALCACRPPRVGARTAPGLLSVYLANVLARAFFALTFCEPMKESMVIAMARSMSRAEQYSDNRILQKDSAIRMMASR